MAFVNLSLPSLVVTSILVVLASSMTTAAFLEPKLKTTHLHFYLHDLAGANRTAVRVATGNITTPRGIAFGDVAVCDDPLTKEPSISSDLVGRFQGMYTDVSNTIDDPVLLLNANLIFLEGQHNGSTIAIFGRKPLVTYTTEVPIIGGTGLFRLATGYALLTEYSADAATRTTVVEYNVTVFHH